MIASIGDKVRILDHHELKKKIDTQYESYGVFGCVPEVASPCYVFTMIRYTGKIATVTGFRKIDGRLCYLLDIDMGAYVWDRDWVVVLDKRPRRRK